VDVRPDRRAELGQRGVPEILPDLRRRRRGVQLAITPASSNPIIGASAVVYGLLVAFALLYPETTVPVLLHPLKAKYMAILFGVIEFMASAQGGTGNVANIAHLAGC